MPTFRENDVEHNGMPTIQMQPFSRGDPIYVIVSRSNAPDLHFAGKVAFARSTKHVWLEVGIQFQPRRNDDPLETLFDPDGENPDLVRASGCTPAQRAALARGRATLRRKRGGRMASNRRRRPAARKRRAAPRRRAPRSAWTLT